MNDQSLIAVFVSLLASLALAGCHAAPPDLVDQGEVQVHAMVTRPLLHRPQVRTSQGVLVVSGGLDRSEAMPDAQVQVVIRDPTGAVVKRASGPYTVLASSRRVSRPHASYEFRFELAATKGLTVWVSVEAPPGF
jgi:hypothetical protein